MADPTPTPDRCEDQNHRRLFYFGLAMLASFTFVIYLIWLRELRIGDAVLATIITLYVGGISQVVSALGGRRIPPPNGQEKQQ